MCIKSQPSLLGELITLGVLAVVFVGFISMIVYRYAIADWILS